MTVRISALGGAIALFGALMPMNFAAAQAATPDGSTVYRQRCASCHGADLRGRPGLGPDLVGVTNRAAASTPFKYSPALKKSQLKWTQPNLDAYLTAPQRKVPGTRMFVALPDSAQRKAIISFLASRR